MIIVLKSTATAETIAELSAIIASKGLKPLHMPGTERTVIGALGDPRVLAELDLAHHAMVESVKHILAPYKLVTREFHSHDTLIQLGPVLIGGGRFIVGAGPIRAGSPVATSMQARELAAAGIQLFRCADSYRLLSTYLDPSEDTRDYLTICEAARGAGLPSIVEVCEMADVAIAAKHADALELRRLSEPRLLNAVAHTNKCVVLARGPSDTLEQLLLAAERIIAQGNPSVILCERGTCSFDQALPNTTDFGAIAWLKQHTHLPVMLDPAHSAGSELLVPALTLAALAVGADGVFVNSIATPSADATSAGSGLDRNALYKLMMNLRSLAVQLGKEFAQ
jgi:3-deoxy-7-phosphoheptulonate synthase